MNHKHIRVKFFQVTSDDQKRKTIIELAKDYFERNEALLIRLPHQKAIEYVDLLLWRYQKNSFLPHVIKDKQCNDSIVLTTSDQNPNNAHSILNLCPNPVFNKNHYYTKIYEFEDLVSSSKNQSAQERYQKYKEQGYHISLD